MSATKVINENKWNQIFEYTRNSKNKMFGLLIPSLIELKYFDYAKSIFKEFISVKSINEKEKPEFKLLNFLILASQFSQRGLMNKWNATIKNGILTLKESKVIPDIFNLLIQHIRAKGIAEFKSDNYLEMVVDSIELNNFILKDYKFNVHVNFALRILDFDENLLNKTMLEKLIQFIEHYNVDNTDLSSRWSAIESKENIQFELRRKLIKISEVSVQENIISQIFEIFDEIDFGYTKYKNFKSIILEIISERITVLNKDVLMAHIAQLIEHSNPKSTKESVFYEVVIKIFQNKNLDFEYINDLISIFENNEDLSQLVIAIEILKSENLHSADFLKYKEVINKVGEINERATFELILKIILEIKNNSIKIGLLESLTSFPLLSNNLDLIIRIATELVKMNATSRAKELVETSINSYKAKFNISNANQGNEFRELLDGIEYKYRISILLELSNFQRLIESNLEVIEFISSEIFALMQEYMANQSFSWSNIFEILFNIPNCENIFKRIFYSNDLWTYADNYYSNSIELFNRSSIIKHLMDNASETNIGFLKKIFSTIANSKNLSDKEELFTEIFTLTKK
ncbi:MAG: hypothetical protein IPL26_19185 [Leptospiraceae bacterium]|nr:hypothetical protein [Leptospiraceae bacterium]